ncbi:MAG: hypothetical protein R3F37_12515 [Candidatus Competibacteraceae bacterium]
MVDHGVAAGLSADTTETTTSTTTTQWNSLTGQSHTAQERGTIFQRPNA